jgi:hypothetical protein
MTVTSGIGADAFALSLWVAADLKVRGYDRTKVFLGGPEGPPLRTLLGRYA